MTEHFQFTIDSPLINRLFQYGLANGMTKIAGLIVNTDMLIEHSRYLQAGYYQRSPKRNGYGIC